MKKGLQVSTNSRQNAKSLPKSQGIQRKRSRSEIAAEDLEQAPPEAQELPRPRILFPDRARPRRPKLAIDCNNLPRGSDEASISEVTEGCQDEMLRADVEYAADPDYLIRQPHLNARMRAVLLDWLFEVGQEYGLKRDTLHFSINFVDRFLSRQENPVPRSELQLVGVTALWIASKMEEILPPPVSDFAAATDGGCTTGQIIGMEGRMVQALDWKLLPCTAFAFANLYLQILASNALKRIQADAPSDLGGDKPWMEPSIVHAAQLNRVMEVLDLAMLDIDCLCFSPSVLAATAVLCLVERANSNVLQAEDVLEVVRMKKSDLEDCIQWFSFALELTPAPSNFTHRPHVLESTPKKELVLVQRHNPAAILLFKRVVGERQFARHPSAQRHYIRRCQPVPILEDSDEEQELQAVAQINKNRHLNLLSFDATRSFSPMTQIAMTFQSTSFMGEPHLNHSQRPPSGTDTTTISPQRVIRFEDSD